MKTEEKDKGSQVSHRPAMDEGLLRAFVAIARTLSQSLSVEVILTSTLELTLADPRVEAGEIYLLDDKSGELSYACHRGLSEECVQEAKEVPIKLGDGITGYVAAQKEPLVVPELFEEPRFLREMPKMEGYHSLISLPIKSGDRVYGVINLFSSGGHRLSPRYVGRLAASMEMLGVAFEYAQLIEAKSARVKELEESEERYRHLVENLDDGYLVVRRMRILFANKRLAEMLGYDLAEIVGEPFTKLLSSEGLEEVIQISQRILSGDTVPEHRESLALRKDGTKLPVEFSFKGVVYAGKPATAVIIRDIAERKQAEEALRESEEKYRFLVEDMNEGYMVIQGPWVVFANKRCAEYTGIPLENMVGASIADLLPPETLEQAMELTQTSMRDGKFPEQVEMVFKKEDGSKFPADIRFKEVTFEGKPAFSLLIRDITERKQAEEALQRRAQQILALQRVTASMQSTLELKEVLQRVSEAVVVNLGFDHSLICLRDESRNVNRGTVFYSKEGSKLVSEVEKAIAQAVTAVELPLVRGYSRAADELLDGKTTITHHLYEIAEPPLTREECDAAQELLGVKTIANVPLFAKDRLVGSGLVFTEREEITEAELEALGVLADQAGVAIENASLYHDIKDKAERLAVTAELNRIIGSNLDIRDAYQAFTDEIKKIIDFDRASITLLEVDKLRFLAVYSDVKTELSDGTTVPLESSVTAWTMGSKRTNIEADFAQEAQFPIDDILFKEGLRSAIRVPLFSKGEVIGTFNLSSRHPNAYGQREREILEQVAGQLAVAVENSSLFIRIRQREMELSKAYQELKAAHDFMVRSERLRALGEMASGVAHDFNNILSIILGRAELALEDAKDPRLERALQIIEETALDGANTVRRLQDFARVRVDQNFESVNLNQIVESALQIAEPRRLERQEMEGAVIEINTNLNEVPPIEGNSAELKEALTNILFNAMDAMPEGGQISINTGAENGWATLSVSDTGVGMSDEIKSKIFDPFFSTKGRHGLGMGLSVTYGIITRHRGIIDVDSAPGKGATFHIKLPMATDSKKRARTSGAVPPVAKATILLVDDDPQVSEVLELMLTQMGHHVTGVTSGKEAISAFEKGDYKLVISDLGMPDMSGREVARAVKEMKPKTPVILITGWGVQLDPREMKKVGIDGVVPKPLSREALSVQLAELLPTKSRK